MFAHEIKGIKATRIGEFTRNGEKRYRFAITGTPAALEAWKKARGQYYLEDEVTKQVIFIAIPSVALDLMKSGGKMLISTNGSVVADYDSLEEAYEDQQMYRVELQKAKAQIAATAGSDRRFAPRTSAPNKFSVPDQDVINANMSEEDLNLTDEERDALAKQAGNVNAKTEGEPIIP